MTATKSWGARVWFDDEAPPRPRVLSDEWSEAPTDEEKDAAWEETTRRVVARQGPRTSGILRSEPSVLPEKGLDLMRLSMDEEDEVRPSTKVVRKSKTLDNKLSKVSGRLLGCFLCCWLIASVLAAGLLWYSRLKNDSGDSSPQPNGASSTTPPTPQPTYPTNSTSCCLWSPDANDYCGSCGARVYFDESPTCASSPDACTGTCNGIWCDG